MERALCPCLHHISSLSKLGQATTLFPKSLSEYGTYRDRKDDDVLEVGFADDVLDSATLLAGERSIAILPIAPLLLQDVHVSLLDSQAMYL